MALLLRPFHSSASSSCLKILRNAARHFSRQTTSSRSSTVLELKGVPYQISPRLSVPSHIVKPDYALPGSENLTFPRPAGRISLKTKEEIDLLRHSCQIAAKIRAFGGSLAVVGTTTDEIDKKLHQAILDAGAYPSPLGYCGFQKSCATSVDQVICHGVPNSRPLENGDILSIDITVFANGFHGDCCGTFIVGLTDEKGRKLVDVARRALDKGIAVCGPNVKFKEIGNAIQDYVESEKMTVIEGLVGHGIGREFHENGILVYHTRDSTHNRLTMVPGMTFTIEPIVTEGTSSGYYLGADGWSAITLDGSRGAQFEETLVVTEDGIEILTVPRA